jgi:hypothetical protein
MWTTSPQGQLESIGLPGVPVWQSQTLTEQKRLAAEGDLASSPGSEVDPGAAKLTSAYSDADWLAEVNRWREEAGVQPVGENAVSVGPIHLHRPAADSEGRGRRYRSIRKLRSMKPAGGAALL